MGDGVPYLPGKSKDGGWSSIVNDILRMGNGHMAGKDRGSIDLDKVVDYFNNFRSHDRYFYEATGGEEGFPMIFAIVQDTLLDRGD